MDRVDLSSCQIANVEDTGLKCSKMLRHYGNVTEYCLDWLKEIASTRIRKE